MYSLIAVAQVNMESSWSKQLFICSRSFSILLQLLGGTTGRDGKMCWKNFDRGLVVAVDILICIIASCLNPF